MYQNYTINQLCLPIDLEIKLEENDFAHAIVQFVDSIRFCCKVLNKE
ncbi:hypothetical protein AAFD89_003008 [Enterococcus faecium]